MLTVQQAFDLALQHHQAGRLAEAEGLYRQILAVQPKHADALHHLGVIAQQAGRNDLAVQLIGEAIVIDPNNAAAYSNLGGAYCASGRRDEGIAALRRAIQLQGDLVEAYYNLGNALRERGSVEEAIAEYRRALQMRPAYPEAHSNLGIALRDLGHIEEAIAEFRCALELKPDYPEAHNNLGNALKDQGHFEEALAEYRRALQLNPAYSEAQNNLGVLLKDKGDLDEAIAALRRAIQLRPGYVEAHSNLGVALAEHGRLDEAIAAYRCALALDPARAPCHHDLAIALVEHHQFDEAIAAYRRALELKPDYAEAKLGYSHLLLLRGEFEQGWPLHESRWCHIQSGKRSFSQPQWDGGSLEGKRILFHAEQGFGDSIQFVRYARLVASRGGAVILECQRPLVNLFRRVQDVSEIFAAGDSLPPFDVQVPMLSLPLVFQTTRETIPRDVPYLFPERNRHEAWATRLDAHRARLRVGLAWAGNPLHRRTRTRDLSLAQLLPLLRVKGIDFFSLQIGSGAEQIRELSAAAEMVDHTPHLLDFADTAAFIAELDLIISVDTAVAHLAGALGRPTWTLLPFAPDWRWGLEREDTPWYPTMRLFRQPAPGDWASVIERITADLEGVVATKVG